MFGAAYKNHLQNKNLEGGIHEGQIMSEVSLEKTTNGVEYMRFTYEGETGKFNAKEFKKTSKQSWQTDITFEASKVSQLAKIFTNQIVPFIGYKDGIKLDEEQAVEAYNAMAETLSDNASFAEIVRWFKDNILPISRVTPLRIKIVYDKNGYEQLPNNQTDKSDSVEPMSVITPHVIALENDVFNKPVQQVDVETPSGTTSAPFGSEKAEAAASDLPF